MSLWLYHKTSHHFVTSRGQVWPSHSQSINTILRKDINSSSPGQNGHHFADDIFRCIFVNEKFCISLKCHWSLFLGVQLTITQHDGLAPNRRQAIISTNGDLIHWRIYAGLGGDELMNLSPLLCILYEPYIGSTPHCTYLFMGDALKVHCKNNG